MEMFPDSIDDFLKSHNFIHFEGYSQDSPEQTHDLRQLTKQKNIRVMEIGFNAGHSADTFLKHNPTLTLTSFDLGIHAYVTFAKQYIDMKYPNRHTLILGDSTTTVPQHIQNSNRKQTYDVIFIDGGHSYEIAHADISNCFHLAHAETVVIVDDTIFDRNEWIRRWTEGPTKSWLEHTHSLGKIQELDRREYGPGRGMTWGRYLVKI